MSETGLNAASPEFAWQNGAAAADAGDYVEALLWLERASKLAPRDPRIGLDLANIRLRVGGAEQRAQAVVEFEVLTKRYDVLSGWLGLLTARRLSADHAGAAAALQEVLERHCVPDEPGFADAAALIARTAARPGWCGVTAAGQIRIIIVLGGEISCFVDGAPVRLRNGDAVPRGARLSLRADDVDLLGSPLNLAAIARVEGMVDSLGSELVGWVNRPAAQEDVPRITLIDAAGQEKNIAVREVLPAQDGAPLVFRHGFRFSRAAAKGLRAPFRITGPLGNDIFGSPIDPGAVKALKPVPADYLGPANKVLPKRAALTVVVPVYRGLAVTQACFKALLEALPAKAKIIAVDDATPEPELAAWLDALSQDRRVMLIRNARNLGFPATANAGLRAASGCDVLLLNSDTLVPPGAIEKLLEAVYAQPEFGSVTPFSNEATILNYPAPGGDNPAPDLAGAIVLNRLAGKANGNATLEIPTGIGFCMLMRHDCIGKTGLLRSELFAQGYGEENDWCLRARHNGFRHVAATGVYVAHHGGVSFRAAGQELNFRNGRILNRLHPGYDALIARYVKADPLASARRRLDLERFKAARRKSEAVLLISHHHGGGVGRRIDEEMAEIRLSGLRPILLCPTRPEGPGAPRFPRPAQLTDGKPDDYPNLQFVLPADEPALLALLRDERVRHVVFHHGLGHHPAVRGIAAKLGCPQDIVVHDYASFCPRVHLLGVTQRYCGEPSLAECTACVVSAGDETFEGLGPKRLVARSQREFDQARRITTPSEDASRRIARHFPGVRPEVTPWEDDAQPVTLKPPGERGTADRDYRGHRAGQRV